MGWRRPAGNRVRQEAIGQRSGKLDWWPSLLRDARDSIRSRTVVGFCDINEPTRSRHNILSREVKFVKAPEPGTVSREPLRPR